MVCKKISMVSEYFFIEYDKSLMYMDEVIEYLKTKIFEIMSFFSLDKLKCNKKIVIWNDLEKYKEHIEKYYPYQDFMCADTNDGNINILSLEQAHLTLEHSNMTIEDLKSIIVHEFVHVCHQDCEIMPLENDIVWFWEALATNLGNPEDFQEIVIDVSFDCLEDFNNLKNNYQIAYTIGRYMLENYSYEMILEYIKYPQILFDNSNSIIIAAKEWSLKNK